MQGSRKLTYGKDDGKREPETIPHSIPKKEVEPVALTGQQPDLPMAYRKTDGQLPYELICVISGGTNRERDFLKVLIKNYRLLPLRVLFISQKGQGLHPFQMQEKWEEIRSSHIVETNGTSFILDAVDKVFLLTDVDEFYNQLANILTHKSDDDSGEWIISNPCFEVWLYYCHLNSPETDLASLKSFTAESRSQEMKRLGHTLIPGGLNSILAFENMDTGIANASNHFGLDENGIPVLFATQMHHFAKYLVDKLNENAGAYDKYIQNKRKELAKLRKM